MKIIKTARIMRHSINNGDHLTPEGLNKINEIYGDETGRLLLDGVTDLFHSGMFRSPQTLAGILAQTGHKADLHPPIEKLGTDRCLGEIFTDEFEKFLVEKDLPMVDSLKLFHGETNTRKWITDSVEGVEDIFRLMKRNKALAIGHMPFIPLAAVALGGEYKRLDFLESIRFGQTSLGEIIVF